MPSSYRYRRRVQFADTDMAGIVHFPRFFYYMEEAEHAFLRSLGGNVMMRDPDGAISWPRVDVGCEFMKPAKLDDELDIVVRVATKGRSSISYRFTFDLAGTIIAEGRITAVCCRIRPGERPQSMPIPAHLDAQLEVDPSFATAPASESGPESKPGPASESGPESKSGSA